jgi:hypothetical protein
MLKKLSFFLRGRVLISHLKLLLYINMILLTTTKNTFVIRFKDRSSVLGYELLNEPWTGDVYADASLILPGIAGQHLLEPFFNRASQAIRAVDNHTIIFWEPVTYAYLIQVLYFFLSLRIRWTATKTAFVHFLCHLRPSFLQCCGAGTGTC